MHLLMSQPPPPPTHTSVKCFRLFLWGPGVVGGRVVECFTPALEIIDQEQR